MSLVSIALYGGAEDGTVITVSEGVLRMRVFHTIRSTPINWDDYQLYPEAPVSVITDTYWWDDTRNDAGDYRFRLREPHA